MSLYINLRQGGVGGKIVDPYLLKSEDPLATDAKVVAIHESRAAEFVAGRHVLLAVHGFNVSYQSGLRSLAKLNQALNLGDGVVVIGVLWPGDYWLPVVNYPAEARDAVLCGKLLAGFVNRAFKSAADISLVSHSLGGRLVLETLLHLDRKADLVCLTAGAVDDDVFVRQYAKVQDRAQRIGVLASSRDWVLRLAYRAGDFASDVLYDDDNPFGAALGLRGSRPARVMDRRIPRNQKYGHGDYFPPANGVNNNWPRVSEHIRALMLGERPVWPGPGKL